jgi:Ion channel
MKKIIKKLLLGDVSKIKMQKYNPLQRALKNIQSIWNNDHQDDNGIEKMLRLFLSTSQLLFPGIYIKYLANRKGYEYQDIALDFYILLKVLFPILILLNNWHENDIAIALMIYVLLETILYIPTLIFASDLFTRPRSYKRSMLLLFFNYLEIIFAFGVLYFCGNYLNHPFNNWFDAIYFSIVTSSSIGYGDYYPITTYGKFLVSLQAMLFLFFLVLFLNFFTAKIKPKGYFEHDVNE